VKSSKDTKTDVENLKMIIPKLENNGKMDKYPPNDPRSPKIESRQINVKFGTATKISTRIRKETVRKRENNGKMG
jgi:hypothetical protein